MDINTRGILEKAGAIASCLGFLATIGILVFTDYKIIALLSLLAAETIIVAVVLLSARRHTHLKNILSYPYKREDHLDYVRYCFDSPTKITYEVYEVFVVRTPILDKVTIELTWSGRGTIKATSIFVNSPSLDIDYKSDTGKIVFDLPLPEPKRFGETCTTHFKLELNDEASQNVPKVSKNVRRPCKLFLAEVQLRYLDRCDDAKICWRKIDDSELAGVREIESVPFNSKSRMFRTAITDLCVGRKYTLSWDPNSPLEAKQNNTEP